MESSANISPALAAPVTPDRRIKQRRGRKTYDALIEAGFALLEHRELEAISIAELAQAAGYSTGAFYARFKSKDEYFDALVARHLERRKRTRDRLLATTPDDRLINALIEDLVRYYWKRRRFWRAALIRAIRDLAFWEPIRIHGREFADLLVERLGRSARRAVTASEEADVRFAVELALGTINNAIINRPGPIFIGQQRFIENLVRAFCLVADYDQLVRAATAPPARRTAARDSSPRSSC
jgi:AcrR family transcriptional regulator